MYTTHAYNSNNNYNTTPYLLDRNSVAAIAITIIHVQSCIIKVPVNITINHLYNRFEGARSKSDFEFMLDSSKFTEECVGKLFNP